VVAMFLSMVGSFFLNCYFTFRTRPTWRKFLLFPLSNATNFVVTTVGLYLLVRYFGLNQRIAPLLAATVAIPVTFVVAQLVLAGRHREPLPSGVPTPAVGSAKSP
jgi:putative flippase GtrA